MPARSDIAAVHIVYETRQKKTAHTILDVFNQQAHSLRYPERHCNDVCMRIKIAPESPKPGTYFGVAFPALIQIRHPGPHRSNRHSKQSNHLPHLSQWLANQTNH